MARLRRGEVRWYKFQRPDKMAVGFAICASVVPAEYARVDCPTLWLDLGGKGQDTCLTLSDAWPLTPFERQIPWWDPALYGDGGRTSGPPRRTL